MQETTTPPSSIHKIPTLSPSLKSSSEKTVYFKSLLDFMSFEKINSLTVSCLFENGKPVSSKEAMWDERYKNTIDKKLKAIKKNDT